MRDIVGAVRVLSDGGFQWLGEPKNVSPVRVGGTFFPLLQSSCQTVEYSSLLAKGPLCPGWTGETLPNGLGVFLFLGQSNPPPLLSPTHLQTSHSTSGQVSRLRLDHLDWSCPQTFSVTFTVS